MDYNYWHGLRHIAFERYPTFLKFFDLMTLNRSSSMSFDILRSHTDLAAWYLNLRNNFYMAKVFAQLILSSIHGTQFRIKSDVYKIDQKQICTICNL